MSNKQRELPMDSQLVTNAMNYHGQELFRAIEGEHGSDKLRLIDVRSLDYHEYRKRAKEFGFQERQRRQKLLRFIARKADYIYAPCEKVPKLICVDSESDELCAVMPPIESYMNVPAPERKKNFYETCAKGDVFIGQIVRKLDNNGLTINLICLDGGKKRELIDLGLKVFCFESPSEQYQINDYVRGVLHSIPQSTSIGKILVSLKNENLPTEFQRFFKLGVITEEDLPSHHKRYIMNHGKPYWEVLQLTLGFHNPATCVHLKGLLGIADGKMYSCFDYLRKMDMSEELCAPALRREQSSKWAYKSVRDGVAFFKAGNHTEAFQCLNKALQIDSKNVEALVARGALFANNNNLRRALEDFEEALAINPHHINGRKYTSETLVALGRYYEERGEVEAALKTYKKSVQINSNNATARESLINLEMKEKKRQRETELMAQRIIRGPSPHRLSPELVQQPPDTRDKLKLLLKEEKKHKKRSASGSMDMSPSRSWSSSPHRGLSPGGVGGNRRGMIAPPPPPPPPQHSRELMIPSEKGNSGSPQHYYKVKRETNDIYDPYEKVAPPIKSFEVKNVLKEDKYYPKMTVKETVLPHDEYYDSKRGRKRGFSGERDSPGGRSPMSKMETSLTDRIEQFYKKHNLEEKYDKNVPRAIKEDSPLLENQSKWDYFEDQMSKGHHAKKSSLDGSKSRSSHSHMDMDRDRDDDISPGHYGDGGPPSPKVVFVMRKDEDIHYSKIYTHSAFKDEEEGDQDDKKDDKKTKKYDDKKSSRDKKKEGGGGGASSRKSRSYRKASSSSRDSSSDSSSSSSTSRSSSLKKRRKRRNSGDDYSKSDRSDVDSDRGRSKNRRPDKYPRDDRDDYRRSGGYKKYGGYRDSGYRGSGFRNNYRRPYRGRSYYRGGRPYYNKPNNSKFFDMKRGNNPTDESVVISRAPDIEMLKRLKETKNKKVEEDLSKIDKRTGELKHWGDRSLRDAIAAAQKINETIGNDDSGGDGSPKSLSSSAKKQSLKEMESFVEKLKSQKKT